MSGHSDQPPAGDSILVFGGTFDPPHRAHVELPRNAAARLACRRIVYVPASSNPLKNDSPTDAGHRVRMLRLALADHPDCGICMFEVDRPAPSYTVDTLEHLRAEHGPRTRLILLLGADAAVSFNHWKNPSRILELAAPAVLLRPPWNRARFREALANVSDVETAERWMDRIVDVPMMDLNASDLRRRLTAGEGTGGELDSRVLEYIRANHLYGT